MRIGIAVDYGKYANASSLNLIARKVFVEMGEIMNSERTFTISAIKYEDIGIGDINQHFDCINIPNMGGYRFPHMGALSSRNLSVGIVGIDEVVLGSKVYETKAQWNANKLIIKREIPKWTKYGSKIRFVHASTKSDKDQLIQYLNIPEQKIRIIPYGVDHDVFKPVANKENVRKKILAKFLLKDMPYFIHVSESNWARKNVFRMLEAFKKARECGISHNLLIIGKVKSEVVQEANKIDGVKTLGFVSENDLVRLIQCADALILPSLHEGFGLPLVEAMACGVPAITSNVFSPPEIIKDAGLTVDPYNTQELTNRMIELSKNKKLLATLSLNSIRRAKDFSWKRTAKELLVALRENTDVSDFNFSESLNLAAYRTLATICEITPEIHVFKKDLLEANFTTIISWSLDYGLENPNTRDFLMPFKEWLIEHQTDKIEM